LVTVRTSVHAVAPVHELEARGTGVFRLWTRGP
jgi:hypothetical protein